jgi:hypothetical protein
MTRKLWRVVKISGLSFLSLLSIVILCALSYRAIRQHQYSTTLAIHTPNGIDEAMFVPIGGINQWITIRGQNRDNPVVLFLHGGPGTPTNLLDFPFSKAWTPLRSTPASSTKPARWATREPSQNWKPPALRPTM